VLRYHGGKWQLAPWIIAYFPPHRVYVEPFGGAASVLLRKPRSYAEIYNDIDGEVVNLFQVVRDRGKELAAALTLTPFARAEYRAAFQPSDDPLESARRLIVRSFMGFGSDSILLSRASGFHASSNRLGTTPAHDWRHYPACLAAIIERLRGIVIEQRPALEVMQQHDGPGTLHYCDPPYVQDTRSSLAHQARCYKHEMSAADHVALAEFLHACQGFVVLSGYDCELYQGLYGDWPSTHKEALADGARPRVEHLWLSPRTEAALLPLFANLHEDTT